MSTDIPTEEQSTTVSEEKLTTQRQSDGEDLELPTQTAAAEVDINQPQIEVEHNLDTDSKRLKSDKKIYAIGILRPLFPSLDLKREYQAAAKQLDVDESEYYKIFTATETPNNQSDLTYRRYWYIAQQMCWAISINNADSYFVIPSSEFELEAIVDSLNSTSNPIYSLLIGLLRPEIPPHYCGGLQLPAVLCLYFTKLANDPVTELSLKLNDGFTAISRAINYVAVNYSDICQYYPQLLPSNNPGLVIISAKPDTQITERKVIKVIQQFQDPQTHHYSYYSCGIDITDSYPFVAFDLAIYLPDN